MSLQTLRQFVSLAAQRRLFESRRLRLAWLLTGLALIPFWQATFFHASLEDTYRLQFSGIKRQAELVYFYYYMSLFPVITTERPLPMSKEGADRIFREHPDSLRTELMGETRAGNHGRVWMYLPSVFLQGAPDPAKISVIPFNAAVFTLSLMALFAALCLMRQHALAAILALLLGSNPFALFEVYGRSNVFSLPISTTIMLFAVNLPFFFRRPVRTWYLVAAPVVSGLWLALFQDFRNEAAVALPGLVLVFTTIPDTRWPVRLCLAGLLVAAMSLGSMGISSYFDGKIAETEKAVAQVGGLPYPGPRDKSHSFWPTVWCGLGDYGQDRGFEFSDYRLLLSCGPELEARWGKKVHLDQFHSYHYYTEQKKYPRWDTYYPDFYTVARDKVLQAISADPAWYAGILARRLWRILDETSPARLAIGSSWLTLPSHGLLLVPVLLLLLLARHWPFLKMMLLFCCTAITPFLIYSGSNSPYANIFHLLSLALLLCWGLEMCLCLAGKMRFGASRQKTESI